MPSNTGRPFNSFYKNGTQIRQSGNTGCDSTTRILEDGAGNSTSVSLSDDVLSVQPVSDDSVGSLLCKNNAGSNILAVDTTNKVVKVGASQVSATTQYAYFNINSVSSAGFAADTHTAIPFAGNSGLAIFKTMGSSTSSSFNDTEPASSSTITNSAHKAVCCYWYIMDDITIDRVVWWSGADTATGEDTAAYLMGYTADAANGSTSGDLSSGVKLASSSTVTNAGYEQGYYNQMTIHSADVDAGKVILFTFASDTINSDYSISATIKFSIR